MLQWGEVELVGCTTTQVAMSELGQTEKNSVRANAFRLTPESRHCSTPSACRKRANTGSRRSYSITSSPRVRKASGMVSPIAFAVLRLMTTVAG
jgi:hypothetical protein